MTNIIGKTIGRYPNLPVLLANTAVSKVIQLIENEIVDPIFNREQTIRKVQSWPKSVKKTAEWVLYFLSGAVRTMPDQKNPIAIVMQEALVETLTQAGIKISEVPETEQTEVMAAALPIVRHDLAKRIGNDHNLKVILGSIFGTSLEWNTALQDANEYLSKKGAEIEERRQVRKTSGWRRFFI